MFSIKESVKYGWETFKANKEISVLTTLLLLAAGSLIGKEGYFIGGIFILAAIVFLIIVRIGYNKIFLKIYDKEEVKFTDIFQEYRTFWRYLGVSILFPLLVFVGLLLFIIPGLFWAVRFSFSPLIVIDNKSGPIVSMKESYAITKGSFWKLLLFWTVVGLINILGMILFGIGLLISIPLTTLSAVWVYRELSKKRVPGAPAPNHHLVTEAST